jgi:hypothetical protein
VDSSTGGAVSSVSCAGLFWQPQRRKGIRLNVSILRTVIFMRSSFKPDDVMNRHNRKNDIIPSGKRKRDRDETMRAG